MKILNATPYNNNLYTPRFCGEIDPCDYMIRSIEYQKAVSEKEEPAVLPPVEVEVEEEQMIIERMRAQFASREAEIKYLREINGEVEPRTAPVIIPPEEIEPNIIDIII